MMSSDSGAPARCVERDPNAPHEDHWLQLNCDRAYEYLRWKPTWDYPDSIGNPCVGIGSIRTAMTFLSSRIRKSKSTQDWKTAGND